MVRCLQLICAFGLALSLTGCLGQVGLGVLFLSSLVFFLGSLACTVPISVRDAGNETDASAFLDAGDFLDAGQPLDSGIVDAAESADAGAPPDGNVRFDAGNEMEAGPSGTTSSEDAGGLVDACDGTWQQACSAQGELVQDCCPAGVACNYLPYQVCTDGSCVLEGSDDTCREPRHDGGPTSTDGGTMDAGCSGTWQTACSASGELVQECCPAGVACNYLPYQLCADGSCVLDGLDSTCRESSADAGPLVDAGGNADAGNADAGCDGTWQSACSSQGEVVQECCPAGAVCNYLPYQICEDGTCVFDAPGSSCAEPTRDAGTSADAGDNADAGNPDAGCDGTWNSACSPEGEVVQQCCPAGVACNYLPYQICEDGSCVTLEQECIAR